MSGTATALTAETLIDVLARIYEERDFFHGDAQRVRAAAVVDSMDFVRVISAARSLPVGDDTAQRLSDPWTWLHDNDFSWDDVNAIAAILVGGGFVVLASSEPDVDDGQDHGASSVANDLRRELPRVMDIVDPFTGQTHDAAYLSNPLGDVSGDIHIPKYEPVCERCGHGRDYHSVTACEHGAPVRNLGLAGLLRCDCPGWKRDAGWPPPIFLRSAS